MGNVPYLDYEKYPKQGRDKGKRAEVCFHFNLQQTIMGTILRDDMEEPFATVILLDDGRVVTAGECQYSPRS